MSVVLTEDELDESISCAVDEQCFPLIRLLFSLGAKFNAYMMNMTLRHDFYCAHGSDKINHQIFHFLIENGCPLDASCFADAVEIDDWNVVYKLIEYNCPMDSQAYLHAKNFETVEKLYELGCPIDAKVFRSAVYSYSVDQVRKLAKFCPMDAEAFGWPIRENRRDIVKLLIEVGCPTNQEVLLFLCKN